jgi:hypothetical protein
VPEVIFFADQIDSAYPWGRSGSSVSPRSVLRAGTTLSGLI